MSTNYDKAYFIAKFEAIPEELWCTHAFVDEEGRHCAMGHCGDRSEIVSPPECRALKSLLVDRYDGNAVPAINDGLDPRYPQPTPKQRILAALNDLP